jgi:uncharacterized SAM-binding protein YcdF (DUF218 family)
MFFVLSKLLLFLIVPFFWIVLLLLAALIARNPLKKQRLLISALVLLAFFSIPVFLNIVVRKWDIRETKLIQPQYSCAIILGGYAFEDKNNEGHFSDASDRFIQGLKLKVQNKVSSVLVSGGNGNLNPTSFREGAWTSQQLREFNIPDSCIMTESNSRNSFENALFSKQLLDSAHLKPPYLLVTSAFHMRRSLYTFRKMGIDVQPYPCNFIPGTDKTTLDSFIPSAGTLGGWQLYLKEMVGYIIYHFKKAK